MAGGVAAIQSECRGWGRGYGGGIRGFCGRAVGRGTRFGASGAQGLWVETGQGFVNLRQVLDDVRRGWVGGVQR